MDQAYPPPGSSPPANPPTLPAIEITYLYDPLHRLTQADDSSGSYFHYAYDSNGNRLTETTQAGTKTSSYDVANRLTGVDGVSYAWDDNGNLLSDGTNTYTYNHANRLVGVSRSGLSASYAYNGLGDRVSETNNGVTTSFTLDLNAGLTQALSDGANTYLYGNGRIGQFTGEESAYFLGDALGSVRQLVDGSGAVTLTQSYEPYGEVIGSSGTGQSTYGYTGEWTSSSTNLLYLRARFYNPKDGRFFQLDPSKQERNLYNYASSNPINLADPSGLCSKGTCGPDITNWFIEQMQKHYNYGTQMRTIRTKMLLEASVVTSLYPSVPLPMSMFVVDTPYKEILNELSAKTKIPLGCTPVNSLLAAKAVVEALGVFEYAIYGLAADYAFVDYQSDVPPCGTNGCGFLGPFKKGSATLCGHCIDASDLGNIMFGLGGAARGYNFPFTYISTASYNVLADWMPKKNWKDIKGLFDAFFSTDGRAGMIGWTVGKTGVFLDETSFCTMYSVGRDITGGYENGDQASQCTACSREYWPTNVLEPNSLWRISKTFSQGSSAAKNTIQQLFDRIGRAGEK